MKRGVAALTLLLVAGCGGESKPRFTEPMTLSGKEVPADVLNRGYKAYQMRCASCHGDDGSGQGAAGRSLTVQPRDFRKADFRYTSTGEGELPTDQDLTRIIRKGVLDKGMPSFPVMPDDELDAVIAYIKTFSPRWTDAAAATPSEDPSGSP